MSETKQIEAKDNITTLPQTVSAETMIMAAVEKGADVDTLERLLAMAEKIKAEQARSAYFNALAQFQADCPVISKTREVKDRNGKVRFRYANLDDIVKQVAPVLAKHGLSYTIKTRTQDGFVISACEIHHVAGYAEASEFAVPIDEGSFMNDAQKAASASSFSKRYAFTNGLGILTSDMDDEAQSLGKGPSALDLHRRATFHMRAVFDNIETVLDIKSALFEDNLERAAESWSEIDDYYVIDALSALAPTKGGCWTVEEKHKMVSDEFKTFVEKYRKLHPLKNWPPSDSNPYFAKLMSR